VADAEDSQPRGRGFKPQQSILDGIKATVLGILLKKKIRQPSLVHQKNIVNIIH
jgi:hypothetical protein